MWRVVGVWLLVLMTAQTSSAQQPKGATVPPKPQARQAADSSLMGRVGFVLGTESAYRDVYGVGVVIGSEMRIAIPGPFDRRLIAWAEGNYRGQNGQLSYTGDPTKVKVTALEGGLLYRITRGNLSAYVGGGIGYYIFSENSVSMGAVSENNIGYCGVAGASLPVGGRLLFDVRLKYSASNMQPADFPITLGGLTLDAGFGVRF
jgi:hypothetical protein